jgi:hypothetical protein
LAPRTRSAYRRWVNEHLVAGDELDAFLAPSAATSVLDSRALCAPAVRRVELAAAEARALSREQLRALRRERPAQLNRSALRHLSAARLPPASGRLTRGALWRRAGAAAPAI